MFALSSVCCPWAARFSHSCGRWLCHSVHVNCTCMWLSPAKMEEKNWRLSSHPFMPSHKVMMIYERYGYKANVFVYCSVNVSPQTSEWARLISLWRAVLHPNRDKSISNYICVCNTGINPGYLEIKSTCVWACVFFVFVQQNANAGEHAKKPHILTN